MMRKSWPKVRWSPRDLPERHERIRAAPLVHRQNVDGHSIDGDVLGSREGIGHESNHHQRRDRVDIEWRQRKDDQGHGEPRLRKQHPWPPKPHRLEREPVHERAGDELSRPGKGYDRREQGKFAHVRVLFGKPRRNGDRQQPERDALGKVERAECAEPQPTLFGQNQRHGRGSGQALLAR